MFERNDYTARKRHLPTPLQNRRGKPPEEACPTMANVKCDVVAFV